MTNNSFICVLSLYFNSGLPLCLCPSESSPNNTFWNLIDINPPHMTQPTKSPTTDCSHEFQHFCVGDFVLPSNFHYFAKIAEVDWSSFTSWKYCPCLQAIQRFSGWILCCSKLFLILCSMYLMSICGHHFIIQRVNVTVGPNKQNLDHFTCEIAAVQKWCLMVRCFPVPS